MYDHSRRLIDHHQLIVFINDLERNVFALDAAVKTGTSEH